MLKLLIVFLHRAEEHVREVLAHQSFLIVPFHQLGYQFKHNRLVLYVTENADIELLKETLEFLVALNMP